MENNLVEIKDIIDEHGFITDRSKVEFGLKDRSFMLALAQKLAPACMEKTEHGYYYVSNLSQEVIKEIGSALCITNLGFNGFNDLEKYDLIKKNDLVEFYDFTLFGEYLNMAINDILNKQDAKLLEHKAELIGKGKAALDMIDVLGKYMETLNLAIDAANAANGIN